MIGSLLLASFAFASLPSQIEKHTLQLKNATTLEVLKKCPTNKSSKMPAVLIFGGFETGADSINLVELERAHCLITFKYPMSPEFEMHGFDYLRFLPRAKTAIHETLEGVDQLVTWAQSQPEIDPDRIILVGASIGSPFVSIVAGRRNDVAALVLLDGFGDIATVISHNLQREWRSSLGVAGKWLAQITGHFLWWYIEFPKPEEELAKATSHLHILLISAKDDDLLPPEGTSSLREALRSSQAKWKEIQLPGAHMRPGNKELITQMHKTSLDWLREEGLMP